MEPACETVDSSDKEMTTENQVIDMVDSKLPVSIKIEPPEVQLKYPDQEAPACVQNVSKQEHSQIENNEFGNMGFNIGKQELSDELCEDEHQRFDKMVDMTDCSSGLEITKYSCGESGKSYEQETFRQTSESVSSMPGINIKYSFSKKSCQLHCNVETKTEDKSKISDLNEQKQKIIVEKSFKNGDCSASFTKGSSWKFHTQLGTGQKPYICDECGASFAKGSDLKKHKRIHSGERPYKCEDCGASFSKSNGLTKHKRTHSGERPYKCDDCGKSFTQDCNLKKHKRIHSGERPYECDYCGTFFSEAGSLKRHKIIHTGERPYKCDVCGASFAQGNVLKKHKRIHTGERPYTCGDCGSSFADLRNLKKHKITHTGERPYKCDDCGASFTQGSDLKKHMSTHLVSMDSNSLQASHSIKLEPACETDHFHSSAKEMTTEDQVSDMVDSKLSVSFNIEQPDVTLEYPDQETLTCPQNVPMNTEDKSYMFDFNRQKRKSTEQKPFKYDCSAQFTQGRSQKSHNILQTGERPYKCDECGASFIRKGHLKCHHLTHTGERPYKCYECGASFNRGSHLKCHQLIHTGERPHKCDECGAAFTKGFGLKRHKRTHK